MPSNTTNLEGYTVFSSVSLAGSGSTLLASDVSASRYFGSSFSGGSMAGSTMSSTGSSLNAAEWTSQLSVGGSSQTGTGITGISMTSFLGVAMVVQGSASSFSIFVWPAVKGGDVICTSVTGIAGISSLSSGLYLHSHCTVAGQVEVRWSNCSTLVQNQSSVSYNLIRFSNV